MTKAQAAPRISYDHGVSDKKLIGETIGSFFDRAVALSRAERHDEALVEDLAPAARANPAVARPSRVLRR